MKYLKKFKTNAEYQTYISDNTAFKPNVSYVTDDGDVFYNPLSTSTDYSTEYLTFEAVTSGTVTIKASEAAIAKTISYSTDNGDTWTDLTSSTTEQTLATLSVGDKLLVKGENTTYANDSGYNSFGGTAQVNVYGNIMSLIYGDNFIGQTTLSETNTFYLLFYDNTNLLSAENLVLPATTLASGCYNAMFNGCTSLVTAPELPATALAGGCYSDMFYGCTSLVTAPELPATALAIYCYSQMFYGCTSLVNAPELPATTLAEGCYTSMFYGCTSLETAPELPATTLENDCYTYMFYGCTNLNYVKMMALEISDMSIVDSWLEGTSSEGTFVKNANATWTEADVIPSGWTVETATE